MDQVIIPSPDTYGYVELTGEDTRTRTITGVPFRKHILNLGELIHPDTGEKIKLDEDWYATLARNFENGVCDIVQLPVADAANKHSEDPLRNGGEVVGISREGRKVFVDLDVRDPKVIDGMRNRTLLGASAFLNMNYKDTRTGERVGPTLLHTCITNRPYVVGLDDYEEIIAATASDGVSDTLVLTPTETQMTKDELLAQLRDEHGIDVAALQEAAAARPDSALLSAITSALQGSGAEIKLTGPDGQVVTGQDLVGAISELASQHVTLTNSVATMQREAAEREVQGYIDQGRVLPKQKAGFVEMALTNRDQLLVMLPDKAIVPGFDGPVGNTGEGGEGQTALTNVDEEIIRLSGIVNDMGKGQPRRTSGRTPAR